MRPEIILQLVVCAMTIALIGCAGSGTGRASLDDPPTTQVVALETIDAPIAQQTISAPVSNPSSELDTSPAVVQVVFTEEETSPQTPAESTDETLLLFEEASHPAPETAPLPIQLKQPSQQADELNYLVQLAADQNPNLIRLYREYQSMASMSHYVDKLPDPKIGATVFGNPIETAAGSQQANLSISQTIPWLAKLNADQQRVCFEAMAIRAEYAAERLKVIAAVRTQWAKLYYLEQQIEVTQANQSLLKDLIQIANARVETGLATQGDVLLGTLELSKLEEQLLVYRQQHKAAIAEINRLAARPAGTSVTIPQELPIQEPEWSAESIFQLAINEQPEIQAAHLRTSAARWGIEVARFSRRPEFMLSANYFITDDNRAPNPFVNVGEDPWSVGIQASIPIWRKKYDALQNSAGWKHRAAQQSVQELLDRYDALLLDLVTEADRAAETALLYQSSILPQAEQTLATDQDAYINGLVDFDRVIEDYRNLFTLELGYHKAIRDLTIANARIQQAAGISVPLKPVKN